ncbi:MAG: HAD family hydrolase [Dehalococcoidia bacterium]|nr:MAG: HAD family hydrolase [Dehalococcoidia bacterium]
MSERPPLRAVIFDWGGTLSHYADIELLDMWRLAAEHLAQHSNLLADEILTRLVHVDERMWERTTGDALAYALPDILREATRDLGIDVAEAIIEEAGTRYLDTWTPHIRHFEDARSTLAGLKERGLRVGMLSNTHWSKAYHEHFLERDGLTPYLDTRCYTSEMTHMKPHPEAFRHALETLGVEAAEAAYVGDRLFDDVFGAQRVGMRGVHRPNAVVPSHEGVTPDATITSLADLLPIVDGWMA